jgi:hypothetical protein
MLPITGKEDDMSPRSKREYIEAVFIRYKKASREKKKGILDEFCATLGYHRKHAIRVLRGFKRFTQPKPGKRGRTPVYGKEEILNPLKRIWLTANLPCSKRLKALLPLWLPGYSQVFEPLSLDAIKALKAISPATIDRLLKPVRSAYKTHGRSTTKPGTLLRKQIPIQTSQWDEARPGFVEADTVAHCGQSLLGVFAYTLDLVDIATGWTEQRAIWGKGEMQVLEQIKDIQASLPFPLRGFDCDNGSEFLNHHLLRHFTDQKVVFTRSRAYHKDDNAHIEQKNWSHVRQWIGYDRLDEWGVVDLLNDLYRNEWRLFHNFFCPSVKLIAKERVGSKTLKHHDLPKTPYQRIMDSPHIDPATKRKLTLEFKGLNPFLLRRGMEAHLQKIFKPAITESYASTIAAVS